MSRKKKNIQISISAKGLESSRSSRSIINFAQSVESGISITDFHEQYYSLLNEFAHGRIRRMIVSIPPQHGKSLGSSKLLPAYLLGLNPALKITIASYSFALARKFGQGVQQVIFSPAYHRMFPNTMIKGMVKGETMAVRSADEFDIIGNSGGLRLVGRESSLTGNRVDVMILDDLYKDALEANSPIIRENIWDWYTSVVRTRMHNNSRELIVFTRWHEDDLVGRIGNNEMIYDLKSLSDLNNIPARAWVRINFEAIKEGFPTDLDPRKAGQALWGARHSLELLLERKSLDEKVFDALYQGHPRSHDGLLYGSFKTYTRNDSPIVKRGNFTDTADVGSDYLCSICYNLCEDGNVYVTDVVYTRSSMEVTEPMVAQMLIDNRTETAVVESNNGGRGFARSITRLTQGRSRVVVIAKVERKNKESRILSNSSMVMRIVIMPSDWRVRWKNFAKDLSGFQRIFSVNSHDDAADALTAVVELETMSENRIESVSFTSNN